MRLVGIASFVAIVTQLAGCPSSIDVTTQCLSTGASTTSGISSGFGITAENTGTEYVTTLTLDGQTLPFVIDTGSSSLLVQGNASLCSTCTVGGSSWLYTPINAVSLGSTVSVGYGSGSGTARVYRDTASICGTEVPVTFDVLTTNNGLPNILGLAYRSIEIPSTSPTFFDQLAAADPQLDDEFSLLLCGARPGSKFIVGTSIPGFDATKVKYTPIVEQSYFVVNPKSMTIAGQTPSLSFPTTGFRTIVDSGTTLTYLPSSMHASLVGQIKAVLAAAGVTVSDDFFGVNSSGNPVSQSAQEIGDISKWPTVSLTLPGAAGAADFSVNLLPQNYLKATQGQYIFGFRGGASNLIILGQTVMENFLVIFDRENSKIGFQDSAALCGT